MSVSGAGVLRVGRTLSPDSREHLREEWLARASRPGTLVGPGPSFDLHSSRPRLPPAIEPEGFWSDLRRRMFG